LRKSIILLLFLSSLFAHAQENLYPLKLIQFSGLVFSNDSLITIPYASVKIRGTYRGTVTNIQGFFSLVTRENDVVEFSSVGFKKRYITIPEGISDAKYTLAVTLEPDTIVLKTINIYPWPTKSKFKDAFVSIDVNKTYNEVLEQNFNQNVMSMMLSNLTMDGKANQNAYLSQMALNATYKGGMTSYTMVGNGIAIPSSLLDPFAWYRLIQDIKAGKFKRNDDF
jgi:hypothetical protein